MGAGIGYVAAFVMVVLLVLNLLPWNWTKYAALALVLVSIAVLRLMPSWRMFYQQTAKVQEIAKPNFEDEALEHLAQPIVDGQPEVLRERLQTTSVPIKGDTEMLAFAISEAAYEIYRPKEKLECVRILIEAGADVKSLCSMYEIPIHIQAASAGNPGLLQLLLENGAYSAFVNAQGTNMRTFIRHEKGPLNAETFWKFARSDK